MAPSLLAIGTAALVLASDVTAGKFFLSDTYDSSNFFSKFSFFESKYGTGNYNDVDPTSGYLNYRNQVDAQALGLASAANGEIFLGPESKNVTQFPGIGRSSVRLESNAVYNKGLIIARFKHLTKPVCGAWPAFWSFGDPWPTKGELDWYEQWNDNAVNKPALHTRNTQCVITQSGQSATVKTRDCDQNADGQYTNEGCVSEATSADPYGSPEGGVYAVEWTDDYIKFIAWRHGSVPDDIDTDKPDTSSLGQPGVMASNDNCNINQNFKDQRLIINIAFCGVLAGNDGVWNSGCAKSTGYPQCSAYVAANPTAFSETYFKIRDIRIFTENTQSSSTISASTSSVSTSSCMCVSASASGSASDSQFASASMTASASASVSVNASASVIGSPDSGSGSGSGSGSASGSASSAGASATGSVTDAGTLPISGTATGFSIIINNWNQTTVITSTPILTPAVSSSSATMLTTSTVFTTQLSTVTACPPTVTNCPVGAVVTKTVALYTTVCPVTAAKTMNTEGNGNASIKKNKSNKSNKNTTRTTTKPATKTNPPTVRTTVLTKVYTITKCPASVPNCPVGSVTTEVTTKVITPTPEPTTARPANGDSNKALTTVLTKTYTITKCPTSNFDCHTSSLTTKTITKVTNPGARVTPRPRSPPREPRPSPPTPPRPPAEATPTRATTEVAAAATTMTTTTTTTTLTASAIRPPPSPSQPPSPALSPPAPRLAHPPPSAPAPAAPDHEAGHQRRRPGWSQLRPNGGRRLCRLRFVKTAYVI